MKRSTRMISMVMAVTLASLFMVMPVLALPPIPSSFYGTVRVNGAVVADGTLIQALINGQVFATAVTQTWQGSSVYALDIPGDDTATPAVDGGREGDIIQFKIGGTLANQTATWHSGTNVGLDLTRTTQPSPTPTPTRQHPLLKSLVLTPASLTTQLGTTSGSLSSLGLLDQSGADNDPSAYVSFQTPNSSYVGYRSYTLPSDARPLLISTMLLQVNVQGPASSSQTWTWSIYEWKTKQWVKTGDTIGTKPDEWQTLLFRIRQPWRYVSTAREFRIQLKSNNPNGDIKIDYESLHITYLSIPTTPTPVTSVATSNRPGISSAPTATPGP